MKYLLLIIIAVPIIFDVGKFLYFFLQPLPEIGQTGTTFGQASEIRYIAAGDSTAVGEGASSIENTYAYRIAESISKDSRVVYGNVAVSGAKTGDVLENQLSKIIDFDPDIVTISMGANDLTHFRSEDEVIGNFRRVKEALIENTDADIYVTNIPDLRNAKILPFWYRYLIEARAKKLNEKIRELESERFKVVNIYDSVPYTPETYAADYFHPSDTGYQNWAKVFIDVI